MLFTLLENVRSAYNVGAIFRSADCAGVDGIFLTGYTAYPPHSKVEKTSLGAERHVPWLYRRDPVALVDELLLGGVSGEAQSNNWFFDTVDWSAFALTALETAPGASELFATELAEHTIMLFGHEVDGISAALMARSKARIIIPMLGHKASLNVASSYAVAVYEYARQFTLRRTQGDTKWDKG